MNRAPRSLLSGLVALALSSAAALAQDGSTTVPDAVLKLVGGLLPEHSNAGAAALDDAFDPNLVVGSAATIEVVFLWDGTGYQNTIGYFTYTDDGQGNRAITSSDLLIENAGFPGSGSLRTGDTFTLKDENGQPRTFQPGERIGFWLAANGANSQTVRNWTWSKPGIPSLSPKVNEAHNPQGLFTSLADVNPEQLTGDSKVAAHVLMLHMDGIAGFLDGADWLLCGFEDKWRHRGADDDFNDVVVAIRSSPAGALGGTTVPAFEVEDPDGDGVSGLNDQFPDDPERATLIRYPSAGRTILGFEDNYPNLGDGDYNDAVVAVWFELTLHADGRVKDILGQFSLVARGASYDSSVGLHIPGIPASATGALEFERFGSGADAEPTLETHRTIAEFVAEQRRIDDVFLSAMQALPPTVGEPFTNTLSTPDEPNSADVRVHFEFDTPIPALDLDTPPFDIYLAVTRTDIPGGIVDIHLPGFGSFPDHAPGLPLETAGPDSYLDANGYPFVIEVPDDWQAPMEQVRIESAYPRFSDWRQSRGLQWRDWYDAPDADETKRTARMSEVLVNRSWRVKVRKQD